MSPFQACHQYGQSIWLDFIRRDLLLSGGLQALIDEGIRGLTSNPAIFEKAIAGSADYDTALAARVRAGETDAACLFEHLAIEDIRKAADIFMPLYRDSAARDGYVSLEVSPHIALDAEATIADARRLWKAVDRPNLMIKVPGTAAGAIAVRQLIGEGINVNVTLLFSRPAYLAVAEAYLDGLETYVAAGGDPATVASVASFFISRIDSAMDAEIDARIAATNDAKLHAQLAALKGGVAIANAKLAYRDYQQLCLTPRWQALVQRGAHPQRLLWASTGTKNAAYRDVLYVEQLIGADTVNTIPPATMDAFRDHGQVTATLTDSVDAADAALGQVEALGLPLDAITEQLVADGVKLFVDAHDQLLAAVARKRDVLNAAAAS
ncbi:transaldolase [Sinimarinibacterium sp. CAU 1509]|uniref:transaldolase n=1 Tax=Sinimarinibacterium sp. CAU 1509 TaxID=2562283 RepID=UPI0010ACE828|nr:transaldolase [Sinimarinibacterium sp. CAU 1509]TJY61894.1 transaldolase [Sinimarinibacterium sp. CAU 1509]